MLTKLFILAVLALILISLFSALALLFRKDGEKIRMVQALTIRVALSVGLFLMLLAGFYFGIIPQRGLR
jgi:formate/nitrite transporter FocA (FNT family)